jgi:hypothetical protein
MTSNFGMCIILWDTLKAFGNGKIDRPKALKTLTEARIGGLVEDAGKGGRVSSCLANALAELVKDSSTLLKEGIGLIAEALKKSGSSVNLNAVLLTPTMTAALNKVDPNLANKVKESIGGCPASAPILDTRQGQNKCIKETECTDLIDTTTSQQKCVSQATGCPPSALLDTTSTPNKCLNKAIGCPQGSIWDATGIPIPKCISKTEKPMAFNAELVGEKYVCPTGQVLDTITTPAKCVDKCADSQYRYIHITPNRCVTKCPLDTFDYDGNKLCIPKIEVIRTLFILSKNNFVHCKGKLDSLFKELTFDSSCPYTQEPFKLSFCVPSSSFSNLIADLCKDVHTTNANCDSGAPCASVCGKITDLEDGEFMKLNMLCNLPGLECYRDGTCTDFGGPYCSDSTSILDVSSNTCLDKCTSTTVTMKSSNAELCVADMAFKISNRFSPNTLCQNWVVKKLYNNPLFLNNFEVDINSQIRSIVYTPGAVKELCASVRESKGKYCKDEDTQVPVKCGFACGSEKGVPITDENFLALQGVCKEQGVKDYAGIS